MKRAISLVLSLLMLAALFVPVSAANTVISPEVLNSITEEDDPDVGMGLAFQYTMNINNVSIIGNRTFNGATATIDGTEYPVVKMGAVVSNQKETGENPAAMVIENANDKKLLNVEGKKLLDGWTNSQVQFAVRIIQIPSAHKKTNLYARPYYIYEKDGEQIVVYGDITNNSYFGAQSVTLPEIGSDIDVTKKKNRIRVSAASHTVNEDGNRQVSLTFQNYSTNWITEETDYVKYTCYDADGNKLTGTGATGTIYIGCIDTKKNKIKTFTFEVPDATAQVKLTSSKITYWTEWA